MRSSDLFQSLFVAASILSGADAAAVERAAPAAYCPKANLLVSKLKSSVAATSFCSWYLPVSTKTSTAFKTIAAPTSTVTFTTYKGYETVTLPATTKVITGPASTVTSISTILSTTDVYGSEAVTETSTQTSIQTDTVAATITTCSKRLQFAKRYSSPHTVPKAVAGEPFSSLKAACACLSIPAKTTIITSTTTPKCSKTLTSTKTSSLTLKVQSTITSLVTPTVYTTDVTIDLRTSTKTSTTTLSVTTLTTTTQTVTSTVTQGPAVTNGDFETGELSPWTVQFGNADVTADGDSPSGQHFLRLTGRGMAGCGGASARPPTILSQDVTLSGNGPHTLSFYISVDTPVPASTQGQCWLTVKFGQDQLDGYSLARGGGIMQKTYSLPAGTTSGALSLEMGCNSLGCANNEVQTIQLDDFKINADDGSGCLA
ncbi:hypothetical protein HII31_05716 [Pseudocercospora fuligena]|uniref:Uncharacterized protein n=1 Tax=Pseudocercospora fuligena TaxID=685502 RepID=A0A8H6VN82_9PEZI|nr:hypothetical protein HII31_05716 [Pseudocercospora fuligena]